jgi:hypothetical protein
MWSSLELTHDHRLKRHALYQLSPKEFGIRYYAPQEGTSMEVPELVPVASFRPHLAAFYEEYDSDYY